MWILRFHPLPIRRALSTDRIAGALFGLAVGDAVGTTVEFSPRGSFAPVTDMIGGGPFGLEPGQWTDDTSMALCLADSLIRCGGMEPADQMERYLRWWQEGYMSSTGECFDIGTTVSAALARYLETGDPIAGSDGTYSAGNGSLMRLAPVAMFHAAHPATAIEACGQSSRTTHCARPAVDACRYFGGLLLGAFAGADKETLLSPMYAPVPGYWEKAPLAPEIEEVARGSFRARDGDDIQSTGYVVHTLEAALWSFATTSSFEEGCLRAAKLGWDADTTAAVYGQIGGAFYGRSGIPERWIRRLDRRSLIEELTEGLISAAGVKGDSAGGGSSDRSSV